MLRSDVVAAVPFMGFVLVFTTDGYVYRLDYDTEKNEFDLSRVI